MEMRQTWKGRCNQDSTYIYQRNESGAENEYFHKKNQ